MTTILLFVILLEKIIIIGKNVIMSVTAITTQAISMEPFTVPKYTIKRQFMELDPTTGEPYMARWMREHREEALSLELRPNLLTHQDTLICHVERVVASTEA